MVVIKISRFLDKIHKNLLYTPRFHNFSVKMILDTFYSCLSKKEKETFKLQFDTLKESLKSKQTTIDEIIAAITTDDITEALTKLKNP